MTTEWKAESGPLARYLAGELSPPVALALLLSGSEDPAALEAALAGEAAQAGAEARRRIGCLLDLLRANREGCARAVALARGHREAALGPRDEALARFRRFFEEAVRIDEDASVALYSLGSRALLAEATGEIVALFDRFGLLGPERAVLEIGCGSGRLLAALAPRVGALTGIDVAPGMVAAARRRCAGLGNVRVMAGSGRDLAGLASAAFDLVYAVDSFPYLHEAGLAERHFGEAARVLRPGGDLVICNYSYRGDLAADRADIDRLGGAAGFAVRVSGAALFTLWDGRVFHLRRTARP
jgi:SAM-dependent methyltransferase